MKTLFITALLTLAAFPVEALQTAHADCQFVCRDSQTGLQETLTVKGSGTSATIHLEDLTASGDCTYSADAPEMDGYLVFMGTFTDKLDSPPSQLKGAFLFEPALLNGKPGNMRRFGGDDWITMPCTLTQ